MLLQDHVQVPCLSPETLWQLLLCPLMGPLLLLTSADAHLCLFVQVQEALSQLVQLLEQQA